MMVEGGRYSGGEYGAGISCWFVLGPQLKYNMFTPRSALLRNNSWHGSKDHLIPDIESE